MVANYEAHGIKITASTLPEACTACPFWLVEAEKYEEGECFVTGHVIQIDGPHDAGRMDDCPITIREGEKSKTMNKERRKKLQEVYELMEKAKDIIEEVKDEEQEAHDNLPESFQYGEKGEQMEECIEQLEEAYDQCDEIIQIIEML